MKMLPALSYGARQPSITAQAAQRVPGDRKCVVCAGPTYCTVCYGCRRDARNRPNTAFAARVAELT